MEQRDTLAGDYVVNGGATIVRVIATAGGELFETYWLDNDGTNVINWGEILAGEQVAAVLASYDN